MNTSELKILDAPITSQDYRKYLNSGTWKATREKAIKKSHALCTICGASKKIVVHHKTYKRIGRERLPDLQVLCHVCHVNKHIKENIFVRFVECK